MDMNSIMKMMTKNVQQNPALNQLLTLKNMLDKLPREKQEEIVGNFVTTLQEAVKEQEGK
ncbi:MAG: hypothetical protein RR844_08735 [Clostridium sp.]